MSFNRTIPSDSFCTGIERRQGSTSIKGWNDSRGVILPWDGTAPGESFCPGIERYQGSHSDQG